MAKPSHSLAPGTEVYIAHLKKTGIVRSLERGKVRVLIENLEFLVPQSAVREPTETAKKAKKSSRNKSHPAITSLSKKSSLRIDLHGMNGEQAREACEQALDRALRENYDKLEIVHGHGKGILAKLCYDYFSKSTQVQKVEKNVQNPGVLVVYI